MKKVNVEEAKELGTVIDNQVVNEAGEVIAEVVQEKEVQKNKVIEKALFMGCRLNSKSDKIGISVLRFDSQSPLTGQVFSNKEVPYITSWLPYAEGAGFEPLFNYPVLKEVYVALSGSGNFIKLHKVFSDEEAAFFKSFM